MITVTCPNCDCVIHVDESSKTKTNADKIRSMTDEELSEWRANGQCPPENFHGDYNCMSRSCEDCWLDWLKQEVAK